MGIYLSEKRLQKLVQTINSLAPDLILLGGDYIWLDSKYIEPCFNQLKNLKAPLGVFAVVGNHDYYHDIKKTITLMKNSAITPLINHGEPLFINDSNIFLSGIDDYLEGAPDIAKSISGASPHDFVILLSHNPDIAENIKHHSIDLILSGHTHGGQITLFGLFAPVLYSQYGQKYRSGLIQKNQTRVLVSNGLGTVGVPLRFFARPDILFITLKNPHISP